MSSERPKKRRLFRFSLRAMLLLVTALCIWLGWNANRAARQRRAVESIQRIGGKVYYDFHTIAGDRSPRALVEPQWLLDVVGPDFFHDAVCVSFGRLRRNQPFEEDELACLGELESLRELYLDGDAFTDQSLEQIARLPNLESLSLSMTNITDEGLQHLQTLGNLQRLGIYASERNVTDAGIEHVSRIASLRELGFYISGDHVTREQLRQLTRLKELRVLRVFSFMPPEEFVVLRELPKLELLDFGKSGTFDPARWESILPGVEIRIDYD